MSYRTSATLISVERFSVISFVFQQRKTRSMRGEAVRLKNIRILSVKTQKAIAACAKIRTSFSAGLIGSLVTHEYRYLWR